MGLAEEIIAITPLEAMELEALGRAGNAAALKKWLLYAGWERIETNRLIPSREKIHLFKSMLDVVRLDVEFHATPEAEVVAPDDGSAGAPELPTFRPSRVFEVIETAGVTEGIRCGVCFCRYTEDRRCDCRPAVDSSPPTVNHEGAD